MVLTDEEIKAIDPDGLAEGFARAIESAVLEKLKAQEPDAWRTFDGEGGYDYRSYVDNENYQVEFLARNPSSTYKNWVEPLYIHPLPPDDVVRDAERYRWLRDKHDGGDEMWFVYGAKTDNLTFDIDAAMEEIK